MIQLLQSGRSLLLMMVALLGMSVGAIAQQSDKEVAKTAKVSTDLLRLMTNNGLSNQASAGDLQRVNLYITEGNKVAIDALANSEQDGPALLQALQSLGLERAVSSNQRVSGYLPIDRLDQLKNISVLKIARPSYRPFHKVGAVTSQGDVAMRANIARSTYNVTGAGVKVGILSDSYNARGGAAAGVASGDLPAGVQILADLPSTDTDATDEGRAMAELVHDVAPGAAIAFATAYNTELDFAQNIRNLAAAGCKVITDDVGYFAEPFFQDGVVAQAIDDVVTNQGVAYFSSAGNSARSSYQSQFTASAPTVFPGYSSASYTAHNFGGGDTRQTITIGPGRTIIVSFQWDDPFFSVGGGTGARTDMDLLVYYNGQLQTSLSSAEENIGGDPVEIIGIRNNGQANLAIELVLVKYSGPNPTLVKWVNFGSSVGIEYDTKSSTATGHPNASQCIAVGAAPYFQTPAYRNTLSTAIIENFSSAGGTPILFTKSGTRIAQTVRQKPEIVAVDGTNTTFFYPGDDYENDGFPNFFGTSAAAPHAAAVAALMKQKVSTITPAAILSTLETTALDMDDPSTSGFDTGFDFGTGYGFIQADRALQVIGNTAPTVANAIPPQSATVGQAYTYTIPANTFTDAETPNSLTLSVTGLPTGLSFTAPATISGTPSTTTGSPFNVTVTAKDPGNLTASTTFTFTIAPAAPVATAPVAPTLPNQTATVGVAFSYVVPAFSGTAPITYTASGLPAGLSFEASSRTISGTPTMAQVSMVMITGTNSAGSGSGNFTITVSAAPAGGTFAISGVTTNGCAQLTPDSRQVTFTPQYSNSDGSPISFRVVNESLPTTAPGPYSLRLYTDNPVITLEATQSGKVVTLSYNWLSACSTAPGPAAPVAPTLPNQTATVGVAFSYVVPAFSGTTPITYTASGLPAGLSFDAGSRTISGTPTTAQVSMVTITGTNSAGSGSGMFTITVNAAPVGGNFAISGVITNSCAQLTPNSRQVTFTPSIATAMAALSASAPSMSRCPPRHRGLTVCGSTPTTR
ncbi:putative Ig domain-containing protein [Spirosoma rhododendri]|uniref:S8 family serine peptidase n=1 Tax=Spirosoma rhododendri TaxID=2728024 RepID=A0A7L5DJW4_9BACT|nr:putative Ig domain-containing protein [Spirosoma rhododendri]QJD78739.1 S8 family serine peptidase [Spirosoma rhododendri]